MTNIESLQEPRYVRGWEMKANDAWENGPRSLYSYCSIHFDTLRPCQNGRHFTGDPIRFIFLNKTVKISIKISLEFVPKGQMNKILALVQIMAWRRPGDKSFSGPMIVRLPTYICITRAQWVKYTEIYTARQFQLLLNTSAITASANCFISIVNIPMWPCENSAHNFF